MGTEIVARILGPEAARGHASRVAQGFYARYLAGDHVLDIGYRGGRADAVPITENATGIELDTPGYDGRHLPFPDDSQDAVFASHTLEHIEDWKGSLGEWFRVLKPHGFLVIAVPHRWLYERKALLPSRFNGDHKRFYTPGSLMAEVEAALPAGCWRLRSLRDIDDGFAYDRPPEQHPVGCYEIEMVLQKIPPPPYVARLAASAAALSAIEVFAGLVRRALEAGDVAAFLDVLAGLPLPAWRELLPRLPEETDRAALRALLRALIGRAPFDEADYLDRYGDIRDAVGRGAYPSGHAHYTRNGYFEGRTAAPVADLFR